MAYCARPGMPTHARARCRAQRGGGGRLMRGGFIARWLALCMLVAGADIANGSNCKMVQIADLPVRLESNFIIVDGAINGQKIGIIVDTGASRSLILRSAAERLALNPHQVRNYRMFGVGGETHVEAVMLDEFKLGASMRRDWRVLVVGEHDLGPDASFVLGEDFFQLSDLEFDLAHHALRLYQPRD